MAVAMSSRRHSLDNRSQSSPETGSAGFTAVNHTSSNESIPSSRLSSPNEGLQERSSHTPSSNYPPPHLLGHTSTKRKRSNSEEDAQYSSQRHYDYSPPKRVEHPQHMADRALHVLGNSEHNGVPYYSPNGAPEQNGHAWAQDKPMQSQLHSNGVRQSTSESHLAEALQRDGDSHDPESKAWDIRSSNGPESQDGYGQETTPNGTMQIGPKRKRNFSNRTKTGCLTCRKRKKKCDEQHPICQNCLRGGFECKGYSVGRSGLWSKPPATKTPVPLQSKDEQGDGPEVQTYRPQNESPGSKRPSIQYEGVQTRPIHVEDHDPAPMQYTASPQTGEPRNRPQYPGPHWPPQQSHPQYTPDHLPPLSEQLVRSEMSTNVTPREMSRPPTQGPLPQSAHPPPPPPQRHPSHPPPPSQASSVHQAPPSQPSAPNPQTGYWSGPQQTDYRHSYVPSRVEHQPPSHVRMSSATFDHQKSGAKTFTVEEVERSRMLRHSRYNHLDPTLQNERHRCERALARYNNACKLDSGVSEEEARSIFQQVIDPSRDTTHAFLAPCKEKGTLSHGVKIEGPFNCTYGYNLKIMDNVFIGKNVTIDDAAKVEIGPRTWIGPNVTILTTDVSKDMVDRKGTGGSWVAAPVYIASEVVIGANAVIYPGVRLERGSTVEPFALVRDPLGENQIQQAAVGPRVFM